MGQYHVLTLARCVNNNRPLLLKIRYDIESEALPNPATLSEDQTCDNFFEEIELVKAVAQIGHGPQFITQVSQRGGSSYPHGIIDFIVMSSVPGENVGEIFLHLTSPQLRSIKTQLTYILEHMRNDGFTLSHQDPNFLRYDIEDDKLYLIDFTFMDFTDPNTDEGPMTEDDMYVLAFNIWREHMPGPPFQGRGGNSSGMTQR